MNMTNNIDYLYAQLNELNSKIGNIYSYIDNNQLTDFKIKELYFKADNFATKADKIQSKIDILENNNTSNCKYYSRLILIYFIIIVIIVIIAIRII